MGAVSRTDHPLVGWEGGSPFPGHTVNMPRLRFEATRRIGESGVFRICSPRYVPWADPGIFAQTVQIPPPDLESPIQDRLVIGRLWEGARLPGFPGPAHLASFDAGIPQI